MCASPEWVRETQGGFSLILKDAAASLATVLGIIRYLGANYQIFRPRPKRGLLIGSLAVTLASTHEVVLVHRIGASTRTTDIFPGFWQSIMFGKRTVLINNPGAWHGSHRRSRCQLEQTSLSLPLSQ